MINFLCSRSQYFVIWIIYLINIYIVEAWAIKMNLVNCYHSFLVLLFVEETRVLAVGVSFTNVTGSVGFCLDICTLACGVIGDGLPKRYYMLPITVLFYRIL